MSVLLTIRVHTLNRSAKIQLLWYLTFNNCQLQADVRHVVFSGLLDPRPFDLKLPVDAASGRQIPHYESKAQIKVPALNGTHTTHDVQHGLQTFRGLPTAAAEQAHDQCHSRWYCEAQGVTTAIGPLLHRLMVHEGHITTSAVQIKCLQLHMRTDTSSAATCVLQGMHHLHMAAAEWYTVFLSLATTHLRILFRSTWRALGCHSQPCICMPSWRTSSSIRAVSS